MLKSFLTLSIITIVLSTSLGTINLTATPQLPNTHEHVIGS